MVKVCQNVMLMVQESVAQHMGTEEGTPNCDSTMVTSRNELLTHQVHVIMKNQRT